jgi:DNA repair protein RAD5
MFYLSEQSSIGAAATKLTSERLRLSSDGNEDDHGEETVSDSDLDDIIGISDSSALEVIQQHIAVQSFSNQLILS